MRGSAVQIPWMALSMITVSPKVTSSELNGEIENRANSQCISTPKAKKHGTTTRSVAIGSQPATLDRW
jgi:hypothetical protein